jgi:hypothetical protein
MAPKRVRQAGLAAAFRVWPICGSPRMLGGAVTVKVPGATAPVAGVVALTAS